jgi:hypothetical protein
MTVSQVNNIIRLSSVPLTSPGGVAAPAAAAPAAARRTRWWVELLAISWLAFVYDLINNLAPVRVHPALVHGAAVLRLEQTLGIDPERSLDRWLAAHHTLGVIVSNYYDNAHFVFTFALLGWLWWKRADIYRPLRDALVLVNLIAFLVFWLYPVAPPRMLPGFVDVVAATHAFGSWHTGSLAQHANEFAAMPSLHISWALWCSVAIWQATKRMWARTLAVVYPCVTAAAVVLTGNHYVLDIVAGAAAMALSFALVWIIRGRPWRRPAAAAA